MFKERILLFSLLLSAYPVYNQSFNFQRKIDPFDFKNETGINYKMPFLGGYNAPRFQFVDIDYDQDPDLFLQEVDNRIIFFENVGTQTDFEYLWRTDDWLNREHGAWFRFADIDNDNDYDLFSQGSNETIAYFVNEDNVFIRLTDSLLSIDDTLIYSEFSSVPQFFDIDCDGLLDLFLGRQTGTITFYKNILSEPNDIPQFDFVTDRYQDIQVIGGGVKRDTKLHGANSLAFGDLNGDGPAELLYGDFFSRSLYYFENSGTCSENILNRTSDFFPGLNPLFTSGFNFPGLTDIDNDGDLDLFASVLGGAYSASQNIADNFYFYKNFGTKQTAQFIYMSSSFLDNFDAGEQSIPAFVDIDNDGDQDLFIGNLTRPVASSTEGNLTYFENIGDAWDPQFQLMDEDYIVVDNMYNYAPAFADLDNDEDFDLLLGREFGRLVYFRNEGTKTQANFNFVTDNYQGIDVGAVSVPAFLDVDNDNDMDLLIGEFSGNINYYENQGDINSADFVLIDVNFAGIESGQYSKPSVYDFDDDGDKDLLVGNEKGEIHFYRNDSGSVFNRISDTEKVLALSSPVMVDIDNDGDADLFSGTLGGGIVYFENETISTIEPSHQTDYKNYSLLKNYPNPFNPITNFEFRISNYQHVNLSIFNLLGQKIATLVNKKQQAGSYQVQWDATGFASGVYIYILETSTGFKQSRKLVLLK